MQHKNNKRKADKIILKKTADIEPAAATKEEEETDEERSESTPQSCL